MASQDEARADGSAGDLLGPAWSLRWRAPELALLFAERAGAVAQLTGEGPDRLRAEATVVVASCRLGQRLDVVDRGIAALRLTEQHSDPGTAAILRVELAGCARAAGVPLVGAAVLRPVLTADGVRPSVRADALVELVSCLAQLVDPGVLDDGLAEADRLYAEAGEVDADTRVVRRALLRSVASGELRRRGDIRAAVDAAQEGADLLGGLNRTSADNGAASARVALRLVHGLLDLGRVDEAGAIATAELAKPVRAPAATAVGWLALAIAIRQHLAAGAPVSALALLREAAELAERHRLGTLRAEVLTTMSDAHERVGQLAEALDCLRTAQGVRLRRARAIYGARTTLVGAFGETAGPEDFVRLITGSGGRRAAGRAVGRENAAALLGRFGMRHPIGTAVSAGPNTDVTMVLVDATHGDGGASLVGEQVVSQLLDRVRAAAPTQAQVARVGGAELAVLLPATIAGRAEHWVERLRGAIADVDWSTVAPGLAVNVRVAVAQQTSGHKPEPALTPAARPARAAQPARTPASRRATTDSGPARFETAAQRSASQPTPATQPEPAVQPAAQAGMVAQPASASQPGSGVQPGHAGQPGSFGQSGPSGQQGSAVQPGSSGQQGPAVQPGSSGQRGSAVQPGSAGQSAAAAAQPASAASFGTGSGAAPSSASGSMFELPTVPIMPVDIGADPHAQAAPETPAGPGREPTQPALPIPPPLEPEPPVSTSPVFRAATPSQDLAGDFPMSADPSVRISAADISSVEPETGRSGPRHAVDTGVGPSVLSSLGIAAGSASGGGRRRAKEAPAAGEPADSLFGATPAEPPTSAGGLTDLGRAFRPKAPDDPTPRTGMPEVPADIPLADIPDFLSESPAHQPEPRTDVPDFLSAPRPDRPARIPAQPAPADPAPVPPEPRRTGRRRRSVQLADLLTEALMAYQSAQDSNEAKNNPLVDPSSSVPGPTSLPGPPARPVDRLDQAVGGELPGHPARHRGDSQSGDSGWLTARWKPSDERS
ncbi:MAG TPA: hypothetical protein VHV49_08330 [Pseudonocardiaceae bacterium]|nr:hypothetical protein [Pseudonocardiaceae bacterium]